MTSFVKRSAVLVGTLVAIVGGFTDGARAINPEQTTERGVVNTLGYNLTTGYTTYGSINDFWAYAFKSWGRAYARPGISFYGGTYGNYATACGSTSKWPNNSFYCWDSGGIYLDYPFMQSKLQLNGDYYPGAFLAHEWGHRIQHHLGSPSWYSAQGNRSEYHADCLAGMNTRYGYDSRRLTETTMGPATTGSTTSRRAPATAMAPTGQRGTSTATPSTASTLVTASSRRRRAVRAVRAGMHRPEKALGRREP